ncbi:MAG: UDP-glucose/GDP-mannose dehydrogenase family protein [Pseudomonadota bacterium]
MRICVVGPGYVGLVTATCFAEMGNDVTCVGRADDDTIERLNRGEIPIHEPGLDLLAARNQADGRLRFTCDLAKAISESLVIMIAVGTPPDENGAADLRYVLEVARSIGRVMEEYRVVVCKSTVPVGTAEKVAENIQQELDLRGLKTEFDVVSNPEFLKEGDAVADFMKPDRVVIGTDNPRTAEIMKDLYAPFARTRDKLIVMDARSAELTKYAANAMLASKISFMNEMAAICERVGADVNHVRKGIGSDSRIGYQFIFPGCGYGGSCFPKDVRALISTAREGGYAPRMLQAVEDVNNEQKGLLAAKILAYFADKGGLSDKKVAVWGLAFKPNTDDMREAPSIEVIRCLVAQGAHVQAFDPVAVKEAKRVLGREPGQQAIAYFDKAYDCLAGADCLALITEWNLFRKPDLERMKSLLKSPVIFDGRNQYDPEEMAAMGFSYFCFGREHKPPRTPSRRVAASQ